MYIVLNIVLLLASLGFFIFAIWYTAYRLHTHFKFIPFWVLQVAVAFGAIGSLFASSFTSMFSNHFVSILYVIGGYLLLFLVYMFILFILLHIIQIKWKPPLVWSGITVIATALIVTIVGAVMGSSFVVSETEVKIPGLEKELTIMQISDVHLGHHRGRDYLAKIVDETNKRNPDLVLITGDFVEAEPALQPGVLDPLSDFKAPVYFIEGNHEEYLGAERALKLIEQQGVRIMHNEVIMAHGIQLVGLDYMKADSDTFDMHPSKKTDTIKSVLGKLSLKNEVPSILVHHSPSGVKYADAAGIDLMLSGHTHGGQWFPITLLSDLILPFDQGLYQQGKTKVFVSQGAGTYMMRVRLGSVNEINLIRLVPGN